MLAYAKLLARLDVGGNEVVAVFTVKRLTDGSQFYNTVALDDGQNKTPVASPRDTPIAGEHATSANTGVSDFVRRPLARVKPESVSKVVDQQTGEPLVVAHGTHGDFTTFSKSEDGGYHFGMADAANQRVADMSAEGMADAPNVMPVYLSLKNPARMPDMGSNWGAHIEAMKRHGHDGIVYENQFESPGYDSYIAFYPEQIKSATGNIGTFDGGKGDVRFSRQSPEPAVRADDESVVADIDRINARIAGLGARVHLAATFEDLPQQAQDAAKNAGVPPEEFRGVTMAGGQVYIVQGNHSDAADIQATVVHEVYGHVGLRALFGPDIYRRLNKLYLSLGESKMRALAGKYGMADSYFAMAEAVKAPGKMARRAGGTSELRNGWLTEELLAHIAERETGTLRKQARELVGAIRAWLREHGFARLVDLGMTDIAHILKRGRLALENGDGFTGVDAPPAFRRVDTATQGDTYALPEERFGGLRRKMQDYFIRALQAQEAVASQGGKVSEKEDFYRAEELSSGRRAALVQDFASNTVEPLMQRAAELGVDLEELALYAYAKHAEERNDHIAGINDRFADGGSGMTTADANAVMDKVRQEGREQAFEELHQGLMGITAKTRALLLSEGLITADEFDALQGQYQNYIPLRGFERVDERGEPSGRPSGKGFNIRGKET
ncbi:MAG TPA: hypothetical protein PLL92_02110, partial [Alicycliphilus sp.]|nr:hypothetical protein [Alicycliphilus sp.]